MKEKVFVIGNRYGIHARPAAELVTYVLKAKSKVDFFANGKSADGKSLLMLMALGTKQGDEVRMQVSGVDEEAVFTYLSRFIENHFNENN